jgi:hypothetical protein
MAALLKIKDSDPSPITAKLETNILEASFDIRYEERPDLESLELTIGEIEVLSRSNGDSFRGTVFRLRAILMSARGMWEEAVKDHEARWSNRETDGICEVCGLSDLLDACVEAGDREKSDLWLGELRKHNTDGFTCKTRSYKAQWLYSMRYGSLSDSSKLSKLLYEAAEHSSGPSSWMSGRARRVRSLLLERKLGDPLDRRHPALRLMRVRIPREGNMEETFNWKLLVADYRLASLRFAAGFAPTNDLFYNDATQKSAITAVMPSPLRSKRARATLLALDRAEPFARFLDRAFQCSWRSDEINERKDRVRAAQM